MILNSRHADSEAGALGKAMILKRYIVILMLILVTGLSACSRDGTDLSVPALAMVDGVPITRTLLNVYLQQQGIAEPTPEQTGEALNNLIQLLAVSNAARAQDDFISPELSAELELQQRRLLFERYAQNYIARYQTSDEELRKQYQETVANTGGKQYRLETVIFPDEQQALSAILELQNGAEYSRIASNHPTEALDWVDLTQIPGDYAQAVKATAINGIAPIPLPSPQGWRLVKVVETRPFDPPPFEQVKEGMRRDLNRQKVEVWTNRLREQADVVLENIQVE